MSKLHVSFILDETGSMGFVKDQTISGFNEYLEHLRKDKNDIRFTLAKFNSQKVEIVYSSVKLDKVKKLNDESYEPKCATPLYDAIGQTINELGKKKKVLIIIQTDGHENASKEFSRDDIFKLIKKKKALGWAFVFMGADQDAWLAGSSIGINKGNVINYDSDQTKSALRQAARVTTHYTSTGQTENLVADIK